jgi:DNA polymerase III delta prime subunit
MIKKLWVEKYRPNTLNGYVFKDDSMKKTIERWITEQDIPHILLSGGPGTGKTTLAKILITELGISDTDVLTINASRENSVEDIRTRITSFCQSIPWGNFKIVLLDEADYLSYNAQGALRGVMEQYASVVRFILTCNYRNKIIPAVHSRCQSFHIKSLDTTEFTVRIAEILTGENIEFDLDLLDIYVRACYPDLRKTINTVQLNIRNNKLTKSDNEETSTDYKIKILEMFKTGKLVDARKFACANLPADEYENFYKFLYQNLEFITKDTAKQDEAILVIRDGLYKHSLIADPEINLSATMIQLTQL